jgi:hypothetical protein
MQAVPFGFKGLMYNLIHGHAAPLLDALYPRKANFYKLRN